MIENPTDPPHSTPEIEPENPAIRDETQSRLTETGSKDFGPQRPPLHLAQGLLMGTSDIIPGISGGTIALIVGIYERLIEAIRTVTHIPVEILKGRKGDVWRVVRAIEWKFILSLALGIGLAVVIGARIIPGILEAWPEMSRAVFFGLVAASLVVPWRRISDAGGVRGLIIFVATAVIGFSFVGMPALHVVEASYIRVFVSAAIAICALLLPGVSGAFLLAVLGMYEHSLNAINAVDIPYILIFMLGAITGMALFSRILSFLLTHHHDVTMLVMLGLMAGSLRALWPWQGEILVEDELIHSPTLLQIPATNVELLSGAFFALAGFAVVIALIWLGERRARQNDE